MSKDTPQFGDVKIFNERESTVCVHVQMAYVQPDGSVVPNGQIPELQALGNTKDTATSYVFGPGRPQGNCVLVSVFDGTNATELASFGPTGVACRLPGGALENVFDVVVRVLQDVVGGPAYCPVNVRLHYGAIVNQPAGRKSVRAWLKPDLDLDNYVVGASVGSTIGTLDGLLRVGVQTGDLGGAKVVKQAPTSETLDDKWAFLLKTAEPAKFGLVSLNQDAPAEPVMSASIGADAELMGIDDPVINHLLPVKLFHNDGVGVKDVFDGWQIACAQDGRLLSSLSNGAGTLRFLPRDAPEAFNQIWKITKSA